jgi:hypothetical protein
MAEHDVMADVAEKVSYYKTRAHRKARSHYLAAKYCQRRHTLLGVPVVAGTSIVGTSIFATLTEEPWIVWKIATGVISIAAAVLAALQTFFGFAEQAEKNL